MSEAKGMTLSLRIWRQEGPKSPGSFMDYTAKGVLPDMSFLEMMDVVNEELQQKMMKPLNIKMMSSELMPPKRAFTWKILINHLII